jgi:hypothetical protein
MVKLYPGLSIGDQAACVEATHEFVVGITLELVTSANAP